MGMPTRRAVVKGTAAFAGLAAVQASGLGCVAEAASTRTGCGVQPSWPATPTGVR
jgi:hypothetical protein